MTAKSPRQRSSRLREQLSGVRGFRSRKTKTPRPGRFVMMVGGNSERDREHHFVGGDRGHAQGLAVGTEGVIDADATAHGFVAGMAQAMPQR